jgi:hypothetical protein
MIKKGVRSKEALYLPPHWSLKRRIENEDESQTIGLLPLEELIDHIFPSKYQPKYNQISLELIKLLINNKGKLGPGEVASLLKQGISKATLYNRIIPKLRAFGLIKIEREISDRKSKRMMIRLSKTFSNYLYKIANSWIAILEELK